MFGCWIKIVRDVVGIGIILGVIVDYRVEYCFILIR